MSQLPLLALLTGAMTLGAQPVAAEGLGHDVPLPSPELRTPRAPREVPKGMHPSIALRDRDGENVLDSGGWVDFERTCGACHDAAWIGEHGYHFRLGLDEQTARGQAPSERAWDFGPGLFGRWDPLAGYDSVLSELPAGSEALDRWVNANADRLAGGGPALLGEQAAKLGLNCALCHVAGAALPPKQAVPLEARQTASLVSLGLVELDTRSKASVEARWVHAAFSKDGTVQAERFRIQAPSSEACGACHGIAGNKSPALSDWGPAARQTETTGQLYLPGRISDSTLNLANRANLGRPWDVHAERLVRCADCHFAPNDPSSALRAPDAMPQHLQHEVRTLPFGEFLRRPSHEFAKGFSSQGTVADPLDGSMRRCESCHDAVSVHRFLPKAARHLAQIGCETCHIDYVHTPARQATDYSVIDADGHPRVEYRGIRGSIEDPAAYLPGYAPVLLRRVDADGAQRVLPYNIVTTFFWVVEEPSGVRPASLALLKRALHENPGTASRLLALLDRNHDGVLEATERQLASAEAVEAVRALLVEAGARNPQLVAEMQPFGIHHGVAPGRFARANCALCHSEGSLLTRPFVLADRAPHSVTPRLVGDSHILPAFSLERTADAGMHLVPRLAATGLHVFGVSRVRWLDWAGLGAALLVFASALGHAGMRFWSGRKRDGRSR